MPESNPPSPSSPEPSKPSTQDYSEALGGVKKSRTQAYVLLLLALLIFILLFGYVFYAMGKRAAANDADSTSALLEENAATIAVLEGTIESLESEKDQLASDTESLRQNLIAAEASEQALQAAILAVEASCSEELDLATASARTAATQALINSATENIADDWENYMSLRESAAAQGVPMGSGLEDPASLSDSAGDPSEQLAALLAYQRSLTRETVELENALTTTNETTVVPVVSTSGVGSSSQSVNSQRTTTSSLNTSASSASSATASEMGTENPEEFFAFLNTRQAKSWSYSKDLEEFASTGLTYEFDVEHEGDIVRVPFYSYDVWQQRLTELESKDVVIPPELYSFANYEHFARSIPYFQSIGVYAGPKVDFRAGRLTPIK